MQRKDPVLAPAVLDQKQLFDDAPEGLFVLRGTRIELANKRMIEMIGADPAGVPARELFLDWREGADAAVPFEAALRTSEDEVLPVEVRFSRLGSDEAVVAVRDARALIAGREAEIARSEVEARYRSLVEQIPAVVYADDGDVTTYVNPQIKGILGVTPEDYQADPGMWLRMVHPADRAQVEAESAAFLAGEGGDLGDYRMVRPDGRVVWIRDRAFAFRDEQGQVLWEHGIMFDVTELKDAEARVAHLAYHDGLTGLANRHLFEQTLFLAVARAQRDHTMVAVLYLDLDNFKLVNDSLGHQAGDLLLTQVAEKLRDCTRQADLVARQGGDEFLLLLADLDVEVADETIRTVAARVYEALREPFELHGVEFHARGSTGISVFPRDAHDAETLLKNADIAMYRAKRLEPGGHLFFAADANDALERLSFATRLRQAAEEEQWVLHYQPVVDLADRRIVGAEALIRWQDVNGGDRAARRVHPGRGGARTDRGHRGVGGGRGGAAATSLARRGDRVGAFVQPVASGAVDPAPRRASAHAPAGHRCGAVDIDGRDHGDRPRWPTRIAPSVCCATCTRGGCVWRSTTSGPATRRSRG